MTGIINNVISDPTNKPNMIVYHSPAKNASSLTTLDRPNMVVMVVKRIGCNLVFPASTIASFLSIHLRIFTLILSIKTMASFTTIPMSDINQILKAKLRGFPVKNNQRFAPINDITIA
jgi:hypothetical protein